MELHTSTGSDSRSDADLIASTRGGDAGAFGTLYERHAGAALVVARQYTNGASEAEDVVADSFAAVWSALQGGSGPNDAFRAYLFTVVRRTAAVQRAKGRRAEPTDDVAVLEAGSMAEPGAEEPALAGFEQSVVARAFASLPERWQAVLWHSEIEGLSPAQIAPLLGLSANSTAALAYRAREGLRQAYLQQHLAAPLEESHRAVATKLGAYVRGGLGARDTAQVEGHLDVCGDCRALVLELRDVNRGLRGVIAPLVLGAAGMGALSYTLPTAGGVAAGAASLAGGGGSAGAAGGAAGGAGGGAAGGAGGAAAGGAAGGAGAAGVAGGTAVGAAATGAAGLAVTGVAAAGSAAGAAGATAAATGGAAIGAGAAVGAGAASGGLFAAIVGALGGVPLALAAGVAGLVVVAGATVGIVQLVGSDEPSAAASGPTSSATGEGDGGAPGPSTAPSAASGDPSPTAPGDVSPTPPADAEDGDGAVLPSDTDTGAPAPRPTSEPTTPSTPSPTTPSPTAEPTTPPTTDPTTEPTAPPTTAEPTEPPTTPPAGPAQLLLVGGTTTLEAGRQDQELALEVSNVGGAAATGLAASVELPPDVTVTAVTGDAGGTLALHAAASGWSCQIVDRGARCALPVLDAGASARLAVQVDVDEDYEAPDGQVVWHVSGTGLDETNRATTVAVTPAPARLTVTPATATFARGRTVDLELAVRNAGGVAGDAAVTVAIPPGLTIAGGDDDWTCWPAGSVLRCTQADLAARTTSTLALRVTAGEEATAGSLTLTLSPAGRSGTSSYATVDYDLAAPVLDLRLTASAEGSITATVGASTAHAYGTRLVVTVPDGLALNPRAAGWPAACTATGATATCDLGTLAVGEPVTVTLPATVEAAIADAVTAEASATDAVAVTASTPVGTSSSGLAVRFQSRGEQRLDAVEIGAPVLGCDGCGTGSHDNNGLALQRLGATSSSLALPAGATVRFAGLYWSANRYQGEDWTSAPAVASLTGPSGEAAAVVDADGPVTVLDNAHRTYYQSFADVTDLVAEQGEGAWTVGDVAVSTGLPSGDPNPSYYGGWALVVVYDDPDAAPGALTVYDGGAWVASGAEQVFRFTTTPGATVNVGVVAWEGDRGTTGDQLKLDGAALTPRRSSGLGSASNAFDATATGWAEPNSLGIDAKAFAPGTTKGRVGELRATSTGDQYLLGAVVVRVED